MPFLALVGSIWGESSFLLSYFNSREEEKERTAATGGEETELK